MSTELSGDCNLNINVGDLRNQYKYSSKVYITKIYTLTTPWTKWQKISKSFR